MSLDTESDKSVTLQALNCSFAEVNVLWDRVSAQHSTDEEITVIMVHNFTATAKNRRQEDFQLPSHPVNQPNFLEGLYYEGCSHVLSIQMYSQLWQNKLEWSIRTSYIFIKALK